ncbi:hypothetical protein DM02DRAFT_659152 [Periconia macrospinosa]|uniref:Uncharacterized protein n=1 Tax=Periconia macrospinosa TaxID=97972 RepID=A0A2V1DEK5_9PLEO|nr:hypothetical protein DM02DRAFT_659152 [Periconia macrospinosa]
MPNRRTNRVTRNGNMPNRRTNHVTRNGITHTKPPNPTQAPAQGATTQHTTIQYPRHLPPSPQHIHQLTQNLLQPAQGPQFVQGRQLRGVSRGLDEYRLYQQVQQYRYQQEVLQNQQQSLYRQQIPQQPAPPQHHPQPQAPPVDRNTMWSALLGVANEEHAELSRRASQDVVPGNGGRG